MMLFTEAVCLAHKYTHTPTNLTIYLPRVRVCASMLVLLNLLILNSSQFSMSLLQFYSLHYLVHTHAYTLHDMYIHTYIPLYSICILCILLQFFSFSNFLCHIITNIVVFAFIITSYNGQWSWSFFFYLIYSKVFEEFKFSKVSKIYSSHTVCWKVCFIFFVCAVIALK